MAPPVHLVMTTIHVPVVLRDVLANTEAQGTQGLCKVWIVGDRKTPDSVHALARDLTESGLETIFLDVTAQIAMTDVIGPFFDRLPWNNECRRNIGYLAALKDGCRVLLSMDDDNFPAGDDLIRGHSGTGGHVDGPLLAEPAGFHNPCEHLALEPSRAVYPRGFPFTQRGMRNDGAEQACPEGGLLGVTAGMWLQEPDIDAVTWLNGRVRAVGYSGPRRVVLAQNTWMPLNTQNTSVARELIPAFLCVPMGWPVPGGTIQRYGDIWGGYFLQAITRGTSWHVGYGQPVVEHRRNPHDYLEDLRSEYWGMLLTDWMLELLRSRFRPHRRDVVERVEELGAFIQHEALSSLPSWCPAEVAAFLEWTAGNLKLWAEACRRMMD